MLFNTVEFVVFLAIVYGLYRVLPFRAQNWLLLIASYTFYGWWDWRFLFLMTLTTSIDFWTGLVLDRARLSTRQILIPALFLSVCAIVLVGLDASELLHRLGGAAPARTLVTPVLPVVLTAIPIFAIAATIVYRFLTSLPEERRRKAAMFVSIVVQLSVLGYFKYANFFVDSMVTALAGLGFETAPRHLDIILPVGISFYTFQSMSYAIDIYRREIRPSERFFDFALFVSFFPQLVAGPIERARNLLPQMTMPRTITSEQTRRGIFLIMLGFFKKIAIADGIAGTADSAFAVQDASFGTVVAGTLAFAVQIYCDFSGYSDIARGVSKLFGVELMHNFAQPYFARSPREFWQRWHISLSTWLSDYLYKPLGGNRGSLAFTCRNLMLTMVLGGLWHGAAWNYVLWGLYHGTILSIHRALVSRYGAARDNAAKALLKIGAFSFVTLYGWLLFRARSFDQIGSYTSTLLTGKGGWAIEAARPGLSAMAGVLLLIAWEILQYRRGGDPRFYQKYPSILTGLVIALMVYLTFMGMSNEPAQFIYFQF